MSEIEFIACPRRPSSPPDDRRLGFKAANLARIARLGLAVPPAFVLPTTLAPADETVASEQVSERIVLPGVRALEEATGLQFGSPRRPLCVSVRSGAAVSMPGMMDTVLNVGLNDETVRGLLRSTGNARLAWDSYRRLVQAFAEIVKGCSAAPFDEVLGTRLAKSGCASARELDGLSLRGLAHDYLDVYVAHVGESFPQEPLTQLLLAVTAVWRSWYSDRARAYRRLNDIPDVGGTAVTVQQMVYGNAGGTSGSGVAFTRDPTDGTPALYLDFLFRAQGEDVVSGRQVARDGPALSRLMPGIYRDIERAGDILERSLRDMQELEFTLSQGQLFVLQTRPGKRTAWAALRIALDLADAGIITPEEANARIRPLAPDRISRTVVVPDEAATTLGYGIPAGLGIASGTMALDTAAAERLSRDRPVILVREEIATEDIQGIHCSDGILTSVGGRTSHAAVIARQLEKACVVGCHSLRLDRHARTLTLGGITLREGEQLSIDSASGAVYAGLVRTRLERPEAALARWHRILAAQGDAPTSGPSGGTSPQP